MQINYLHNEKELLLQVSEGDPIAFRKIFDHYRNRIYSLGMYLTRSEILSEEIVQDVFLKVWEKKEQLASLDYFNAWLRTVAKNTCSNYLRNLAIEKIALSRVAGSLDPEMKTVENSLIEKECSQFIAEAIRQLPPQQQKVYVLSRQANKKQEEIAREMNISIYTVKEYMKLAQRSIRQYLENKLDITVLTAAAIYLY
jgi:RNA polymerase sigma-70 factor (ECF subfamily)